MPGFLLVWAKSVVAIARPALRGETGTRMARLDECRCCGHPLRGDPQADHVSPSGEFKLPQARTRAGKRKRRPKGAFNMLRLVRQAD
ncbi:hypothetical protein KTE45_20180 [Burkholderia multivorans]|uniref:hypothetical protein n=1 Tax=Burkholderia multivorans TaxID=87883 RepID=UPI001C256E5F|nr:hypothetical protein [Burkholderia multivorans]MBU9520794.1 hypothetical protein [Burkholderia multivorans]